MALIQRHYLTAAGILSLRQSDTVRLFSVQLLVVAASLLANILLARGLGPPGRGELAMWLQMAYFGASFAGAGVERAALAAPATARRLEENAAALLNLVWKAALTVAVTFGGATLLLSAVSHSDVSWLVATGVAANVVAAVVQRLLRASAIVVNALRKYLWLTLSGQVTLLSSLLALWALDINWSPLWLMTYGLTQLLPPVLLLRRWSIGARLGPKSQHVKRRARALAWGQIATRLALRLDRILIPVLSTPHQLGLYVAVASTTEVLSWPTQAYADSNMRKWATDEGRATYRRILSILTLGSFLIWYPVSWSMSKLVPVLFGQRFVAAAGLAYILVAASLVYGLSRVVVGYLSALDRGTAASMADAVSLVVSSASLVAFVPAWGVEGAAVAALSSSVMAFALSLGATVVFEHRRRQ